VPTSDEEGDEFEQDAMMGMGSQVPQQGDSPFSDEDDFENV
jgi:hypothetical protein